MLMSLEKSISNCDESLLAHKLLSNEQQNYQDAVDYITQLQSWSANRIAIFSIITSVHVHFFTRMYSNVQTFYFPDLPVLLQQPVSYLSLIMTHHLSDPASTGKLPNQRA